MTEHEMSTMIPYPENDLYKALMRAPLLGWRLGLEKLLGHLFVVITTTGRKSGLPRRVVTEYFVMRGKLYVVCAFGKEAAWYKNIAADSRVTLQTWQGPESMRAVLVRDAQELRDLYAVMMQRNGLMTTEYLRSLGMRSDDIEDVIAKKERLTIFRFDPVEETTPPPLQADLVWVWPVALGVLVGLSAASRLLCGKETCER
ncbi:MAG: nitroreductase family deazaflavin-dependent oxidoreductase [Anaerolineae bacterium]|nr:nitroreductase family deazaflavin-dependent oxidoreductase [Anaerolineae bacterium]